LWLVGLVSRRGVLRLPLPQWLSNFWIKLVLLYSTDEGCGWVGDVGGETRQSMGCLDCHFHSGCRISGSSWCCWIRQTRDVGGLEMVGETRQSKGLEVELKAYRGCKTGHGSFTNIIFSRIFCGLKPPVNDVRTV
jgi:hypothetical protein